MLDFDEALERFQLCDLEYGPGLANHGPMAADALLALGHGSLIGGYVDVYAPRLPAFQPGTPIAAAERGHALGRSERRGDWVASFEAELREAAWQEILVSGVTRLLDGMMAGAAHGWLRVAHAVRALEAEQTPARVRELAFGLGYWASRYQLLPGHPGANAKPGNTPDRALAAITPLRARDRSGWLLFDAVRPLDGLASFEESVDSVDLDFGDAGDVGSAVGGLCRAAATLYLANPHARIAYVHALTAPSALRIVLPHLPEPMHAPALGAAYQCAAALHAVSAGENRPPAEIGDDVRRTAEDPAEIRYRAACSLDEHAIKFVEACLRENALHASPTLLLAAADAALHLTAGRPQTSR